ncbi:hypothetical protein DICVIV_10776 [Dictyocaulus viviparus]|uniref:Transmembrane protein n=1 Tax=Dictyocaulus viviparus TaxID=29172 RepID=A0A0D8XLH7_DICVI|nr:hypothetical protein DICVIV_10776 [Dictyocaulus viviparus]
MSSCDSQSAEPSSRVVDLWRRSKPSVETNAANKLPISRTTVSQLLSGERSLIWTNLSQMSPSDRTIMMRNIVGRWPYTWERRALNWPMPIATKINSDMMVFNPKMTVLESIRKCPLAPFVFGVYSSGVIFYALKQVLITPYLFNENVPCSSCILSRNIILSLASGIVMPLLTTPYLCYYIILQGKSSKYPLVKNYIDFLALSWEGSRAARSVLLKCIPLQAIVAAISTYTVLWGRERVLDTLDADPDFARELLISVQLKPTIKQRFVDFLSRVPYCSDIIGKPAPETEQLQVT